MYDLNVSNSGWTPISMNTFITPVFSGWIMLSKDSRYLKRDDNEPRQDGDRPLPIAVSSATVYIPDPQHDWKWTYRKKIWENIGRDIWRTKVNGGWVVKTVIKSDIQLEESGMAQEMSDTCMEFIPDVYHRWFNPKPIRTEENNSESIEETN